MANYKLIIKQSVAKGLYPIPKSDVANILKRIKSLTSNPTPVGSERLSGQSRYRIRQGNHRILYEIEEQLICITIVKIGHRRDV